MELKEIAQVLNRCYSPHTCSVQISYLERKPPWMHEYSGSVPASCFFWQEGMKDVFCVPISGHIDCEIGAFILGVRPEGEYGQRLLTTVRWMEETGYLAEGEYKKLERRRKAPSFVAYGPFGSLDLKPDAVIMLISPQKAMIAAEVYYRMSGSSVMNVTGRPACSILPYLANRKSAAAVSFGCTGFRTYVGKARGRVLLAIRGKDVERFAQISEEISEANNCVAREDRRRKLEAHH